jgi:hypothetical protein
MEEIPSSILMVVLIIDDSGEGSNPCLRRAMAVVKTAAASAMTMVEGGSNSKVEQR